MTSPTAASAPVSAGRIRARRIRFSFPSGTLDRHFVDDDLIMSHAVAILSAVFPEGEDFFVRSVRHYSGRITDPELRSQVAGFIGQEVTHGREHRNINERLQQMGYPAHAIDRFARRGLALAGWLLPHRLTLAMTAAFEHYTATLADLLLTSPKARALLTSDEVRALLLWHAYEEVEHKAVAFDVYRYIGGGEALRIWTMRAITVIFVGFVIGATTVSLAKDKATYNPWRLLRSLAALRHSPWLTLGVLRELRTYNRRGFHPNDNETKELIKRWRTELFGKQGALAGHLTSRFTSDD